MVRTIFEIKPGSFVFEKPTALAPDVCGEIIRRFESNPADQYPGRIGQAGVEDLEVKCSTDLVLSNKPHWQDVDGELFRSLNQALIEFKRYFPYFGGPFKDSGYAVQRTSPGEFFHWHIDGGSHDFSQRQLVAIWYLNTLNAQGGETEFEYQKIEVNPEAGKLILFPPFWTHRHRGKVLHSGSKYIATTWIIFA